MAVLTFSDSGSSALASGGECIRPYAAASGTPPPRLFWEEWRRSYTALSGSGSETLPPLLFCEEWRRSYVALSGSCVSSSSDCSRPYWGGPGRDLSGGGTGDSNNLSYTGVGGMWASCFSEYFLCRSPVECGRFWAGDGGMGGRGPCWWRSSPWMVLLALPLASRRRLGTL